MRQQVVDAFQDDVAFRIEEFVDRRSDRHDDGTGWRYSGGCIGEDQPVVAQRFLEQFLGAIFDEGQPPGFERRETFDVEVVDVDRQTLGGEGENQGNSDMTGTPDDGQVGGTDIRRSGAGGKIDDAQGFSP